MALMAKRKMRFWIPDIFVVILLYNKKNIELTNFKKSEVCTYHRYACIENIWKVERKLKTFHANLG